MVYDDGIVYSFLFTAFSGTFGLVHCIFLLRYRRYTNSFTHWLWVHGVMALYLGSKLGVWGLIKVLDIHLCDAVATEGTSIHHLKASLR